MTIYPVGIYPQTIKFNVENSGTWRLSGDYCDFPNLIYRRNGYEIAVPKDTIQERIDFGNIIVIDPAKSINQFDVKNTKIGEFVVRIIPAKHEPKWFTAEMVLIGNNGKEIKVVYRAHATTKEGSIGMLEDVCGFEIANIIKEWF